jgi:hypothetical protein
MEKNIFRRYCLQLIISGAILGAGSFPAAHAATEFGTLKLSDDMQSCMTLSENGTDIRTETCNGSAAQNWSFVRYSTNGWFFIKNQEKGDKFCLRDFAFNGFIKMDACEGEGYTSSRLWFNRNDVASSPLRSKLTKDLARENNYLAVIDSKLSLSEDNAANAPEWIAEKGYPERKITQISGDKKALLLITHFDGYKPADTEIVSQAVFGENQNYTSLNQFLKISSRNKLNLYGDTIDGINLGPKPDHCDTGKVRELIAEKAQEYGIDTSQYDYVFTEMTANEKCNFVAMAGLPGNWIISNAAGHKYWMWSHEFGHNLGFHHIQALKNCPVTGNVLQINDDCTKTNQHSDDATDTMGGGGGHLYPVNYQYLHGWLDDESVPLVKPVTAKYTLLPLFSNEKGIKGIRIPRKDGSVMVLEYRQPQEGYENWDEAHPVVNGVTVRIYTVNEDSVQNILVDTTPQSLSEDKDTSDAQLAVDKTLFDEMSGRFITVNLVNQYLAEVTITSSKYGI